MSKRADRGDYDPRGPLSRRDCLSDTEFVERVRDILSKPKKVKRARVDEEEHPKRPRLAKPERPRLRIRNPTPDALEPADYTFTWLLQEVRLAKQIAEHWKHDQVLVAGAERIERERWKHMARIMSPDEDA